MYFWIIRSGSPIALALLGHRLPPWVLKGTPLPHLPTLHTPGRSSAVWREGLRWVLSTAVPPAWLLCGGSRLLCPHPPGLAQLLAGGDRDPSPSVAPRLQVDLHWPHTVDTLLLEGELTALPFPYFKGPKPSSATAGLGCTQPRTSAPSPCLATRAWGGTQAACRAGGGLPVPSAPRGWCISSLVCWHGAQHLSASVFLMGGVSPSGPRRGPFAPSSQGSLGLPGLTTNYKVSGNVCVLQQLGNFDGHITCPCRGRVYCLLMGQVVGSRHVGQPHIMPRKPLFEGAVASVRLRGTDKEQR